MIQVRLSEDRGHFDHGWLKTNHTFSFGEYYDPRFMGFGPLRVINEDWIRGGEGFPTHGHRDMEIVTYILEGALEHQDSTGGQGVIRPGELQKMTAGRGVRHSEFNALKDRETHLYQIWIEPDERGLLPSYDQKDFGAALALGEPVLLVSPEGREGSIRVHQKANLWARRLLEVGVKWKLELNPGHSYWLQVARGTVDVEPSEIGPLKAGDAIALQKESVLNLTVKSPGGAEVLFFEFG